jgi:FkbM family methyltransferase
MRELIRCGVRFTFSELLDVVNHALAPAGLKLHRKTNTMPTYFDRLRHMKSLGFSPSVIFDCGAHIGRWTKEVAAIFPEASFFLFEPNTQLIDRIKRNLARVSADYTVFVNAVADEEKEVFLNLWENTDVMMSSSSLLSHVQGEPTQKVRAEVVTLDQIAGKHKVVPELVKLDLQGAELAALQGATELLKKTEVFIIEFGVLEAYIGRTTPKELVNIMYDSGYSLYDIVDLRYRPYDGALSDGDFIFTKNNSVLRAYKGYR